MPRTLKNIKPKPRPGEAAPSEHESNHSGYEENHPTSVPSNSSSEAKGKGKQPERPAIAGYGEARTSHAPTSTSSATLVNPAAAQFPSQQTQVNTTPLEVAVSGLQLGAPPNQSSSASTAAVENQSGIATSTTTSTAPKRQSRPRGGRRGGSQPSQRPATTSQGSQPANGNKRKRPASAMAPSQDVQAESSTAPPKKRPRARKTVTTAANTIAELSSTTTAAAGGKSNFNIFEAIIQHPHLVYHFALSLEVEDLVSVYAISKDFHSVVNTSFTTVIISQAMLHAPTSAKIFPFRCYRGLCVSDPRMEMDQTRGQSRLVPSFRWLRMVCWREQIARKITRLMIKEGIYLPWECEEAIKKLWFLMDIPDNRRRLGTVQNPQLWTPADLFYAVMFFVRFDMRCTDPLADKAHGGMRRLLMAQKSMSLLYRTLERTAMTSFHEVLQAFLRWKYDAPGASVSGFVFGIPINQLGRLQYEGYGTGGSEVKLQRPDELILKECIRRDMDIWEVLLEIIVSPAEVEPKK